MGVVLDWLSRPFIKSDCVKHKYNALRSTSSGWEFQERGDLAQCTAAYERVECLKEPYIQELGALGFRQFQTTGAEAEAVQQKIDECWATLNELIEHGMALLLAYDMGRDIDFDSKFWREHKELLRRLPESLQPAGVAADSTVCKESATYNKQTTGIRKREHLQVASVDA